MHSTVLKQVEREREREREEREREERLFCAAGRRAIHCPQKP
jgi:hypothetical protein